MVQHNTITDMTGTDSSLVDHGKGWIMAMAPLDHLRHGVVEDGDLEHVGPEHLEGHDVPDLDLVCNGKASPALVEADSAFDVLELHRP